MNDTAGVRNQLNGGFWDSIDVSQEEAEEAARIIQESSDPNRIVSELSPEELQDLFNLDSAVGRVRVCVF